MSEKFKVQDGLSLDDFHAGERVTFSLCRKGWHQVDHDTSETIVFANVCVFSHGQASLVPFMVRSGTRPQ